MKIQLLATLTSTITSTITFITASINAFTIYHHCTVANYSVEVLEASEDWTIPWPIRSLLNTPPSWLQRRRRHPTDWLLRVDSCWLPLPQKPTKPLKNQEKRAIAEKNGLVTSQTKRFSAGETLNQEQRLTLELKRPSGSHHSWWLMSWMG